MHELLAAIFGAFVSALRARTSHVAENLVPSSKLLGVEPERLSAK
jgi:hypothetical protein